MRITTLVSACGAPGVTTTALGLAMVWGRPVLLIEADPTGGSALLAGYWGGLESHTGLVELLIAEQHGVLADALPRMSVPIPDTDVSVLFGIRSHDQAAGLVRFWDPLLAVLRSLPGQDVIVDAGRLGLEAWPRPLVSYSDTTVLVTGSTLPAVAAAKSWATTLAADVVPGHEVKLALVGAGRPYAAREVSKALDLPVAASIAWDPRRAAVLSDGEPFPAARFGGEKGAARAFDQSGYLRSLRALAAALRSDEPDELPAEQEALP